MKYITSSSRPWNYSNTILPDRDLQRIKKLKLWWTGVLIIFTRGRFLCSCFSVTFRFNWFPENKISEMRISWFHLESTGKEKTQSSLAFCWKRQVLLDKLQVLSVNPDLVLSFLTVPMLPLNTVKKLSFNNTITCSIPQPPDRGPVDLLPYLDKLHLHYIVTENILFYQLGPGPVKKNFWGPPKQLGTLQLIVFNKFYRI